MLFAEDNDLNAEIATELLTEAELKAEQAADSVACVEMLAKAAHGLLRRHFDGDSDADRERLHLRLSIDLNRAAVNSTETVIRSTEYQFLQRFQAVAANSRLLEIQIFRITEHLLFGFADFARHAFFVGNIQIFRHCQFFFRGVRSLSRRIGQAAFPRTKRLWPQRQGQGPKSYGVGSGDPLGTAAQWGIHVSPELFRRFCGLKYIQDPCTLQALS